MLGQPQNKIPFVGCPSRLGTPKYNVPVQFPIPTCLPGPYPFGAPTEFVLCVSQGHCVLIDIIRHTYHLEY